MLLLRRTLYLILVASTAIALEVRYLNSQGYWVLWSALALAAIITSNTFYKRSVMIAATGLLLAASVFMIAVLALYPPLGVLFVLPLVAGGMVFAGRKPVLTYPVLIFLLFTLLSLLIPATPWAALSRGYDVAIGALIASTFQLIFWPWFRHSEFDAAMAILFKRLQVLSDDVFACFLNADYPDKVYVYERRIHVQKKRFLRCLHYAQSIAIEKTGKRQVLQTVEHLFELILSCALLRIRLTDQTILAVCLTEITGVAEEIQVNIREMAKIYRYQNPYMSVQGLLDRIEIFENNYQTVLQVTAREPLVFLLFISSLKAIAREIETFEDGYTSECRVE